ncbi:hypothetical protein HPP92_004922 [Vanilla planifolia]|uniref:Uncharacterized protein n=1 Tax=Vanilla planifolia TaxID=51239 RepID=A0A835VE43_VANPL|nr:hypothetical protein HPP92_004922 [Vanilla planifolia]
MTSLKRSMSLCFIEIWSRNATISIHRPHLEGQDDELPLRTTGSDLLLESQGIACPVGANVTLKGAKSDILLRQVK